MEKYTTIDGFGDVYVKDGPFDKGINALKDKKVPFWTSEEFAEARMLDAKAKGDWEESDLCTKGAWTAENYNYDNESSDILIASKDFNPILKQPEKATNAHRNNEEFPISAETWSVLREHAEKDPDKAIKSGVLLLQRKDYRSKIPTTSYDEYAPTRFLYREQAKPYSDFLNANDIKSSGHYVACVQEQRFSRALWVYDLLGSGSGLNGFNIDLYANIGRVGGVNRSPAERAAPEKPAQEAKSLLEDRIQQALKKGVSFEHNGMVYVPVSKNAIQRTE